MKFFKFCLLKRYFDTGVAITSLFTKILMVAGIAAVFTGMQSEQIIIFGSIYAILCFLIGWIWFKFGFALADNEVSNKFNLFMIEVREKLKTKDI